MRISSYDEIDICDIIRDYINGTHDCLQITDISFRPTLDNMYHPRSMFVTVWPFSEGLGGRYTLDKDDAEFYIRAAVFQAQCGFNAYFPVIIEVVEKNPEWE